MYPLDHPPFRSCDIYIYITLHIPIIYSLDIAKLDPQVRFHSKVNLGTGWSARLKLLQWVGLHTWRSYHAFDELGEKSSKCFVIHMYIYINTLYYSINIYIYIHLNIQPIFHSIYWWLIEDIPYKYIYIIAFLTHEQRWDAARMRLEVAGGSTEFENSMRWVYHTQFIWLVVGPPLWKIWKSIGMNIPNIWKNKIDVNQTTNQLFIWHSYESQGAIYRWCHFYIASLNRQQLRVVTQVKTGSNKAPKSKGDS